MPLPAIQDLFLWTITVGEMTADHHVIFIGATISFESGPAFGMVCSTGMKHRDNWQGFVFISLAANDNPWNST